MLLIGAGVPWLARRAVSRRRRRRDAGHRRFGCRRTATNLQRQILHSTEPIGEPKTESARQTSRRSTPTSRSSDTRSAHERENRTAILSDTTWSLTARTTSPRVTTAQRRVGEMEEAIVHGALSLRGPGNRLQAARGPCYAALPTRRPLSSRHRARRRALGVLPGVIGCDPGNEVIKRCSRSASR